MKVLFHSWEYPPNGGGVGAYMRNMAQALTAHGHQAVVLCGKVEGLPEDIEEEGVRVLRRYSAADIRSEGVGRLLLATAREYGVDLIEGADHMGECAWALGQTGRPPILIKAHAGQIIHVLEHAQAHYAWQHVTIALAKARAWRQMRAERTVLEQADAVLSPSRRLMDELLKQGLRLPVRRGILPNPAPLRSAVDEAESSRPTLLFVGRIEFLKGIAFLPEILRQVRTVLPDTVLEIVGGDTYARGIGSLRIWLERHLGDQISHVIFRGRLNGDELDAAYRRAWVVLHPSLWDNFPTVVLEAMNAAKPVVSTPHGGMPEMLAGTGCPIVDPRTPGFGEAVKVLMQSTAGRVAVGRAARARVQTDYSPARVVEQYVAFVKQLL